MTGCCAFEGGVRREVPPHEGPPAVQGGIFLGGDRRERRLCIGRAPLRVTRLTQLGSTESSPAAIDLKSLWRRRQSRPSETVRID